MERRNWTRNEMILALNLYLKIPFGKIHKRNPAIIKIAKLIGRTPDAVAYRLANYASFDPQLKKRGLSGLTHGGKRCAEYWNEFINDKEKLLFESEQILAEYEGIPIEIKYKNEIKDIPQNLTGEMKTRQVKTRINQNIFRQIVLSNYSWECALTGIDIPDLLVASHIIPWAENKEQRLNPGNGICLASLYDKAFDTGLISFDKDEKVIFSNRLSKNIGKQYYEYYFVPILHKKLAETRRYPINPTFLEWHRDCIFNK